MAKVVDGWPDTRCVRVEEGRWQTTVFTSRILNFRLFEPGVEHEISAQVWPAGELDSVVEKQLYTQTISPRRGAVVSIGSVDAPLELEILSAAPEAGPIEQATLLKIDLGYKQFAAPTDAELKIELQPTAPLRSGEAWRLLDASSLQKTIVLDEEEDSVPLRFALAPRNLPSGEWELVATYVDEDGVSHRHRFGLHRWCIGCEGEAAFTIEEYRRDLRDERESWLMIVGKSDRPDGTCIQTELAIANNVVEQWPNRECASVENGEWEIGVPLSDLPPRPNIRDEYIIRAWPTNDESAAIQQTFVP